MPRILLIGLALLVKAAFVVPLFAGFVVQFTHVQASYNAQKVNQLERDSAAALLSGAALTSFDQMDERLVQRELIAQMEQPFSVAAAGSSRILQLTAETVGTESFYNFGLSGASILDIMNVYYMLEKAGMLPDTYLIGLDPWLLNADASHSRADTELYEEFITRRLGYNTGWQPETDASEAQPTLLGQIEAFPDTFSAFVSDDWQPEQPRTASGALGTQPSQLKLPDGSALYPQSFSGASQDVVDGRARVEASTVLFMDGYEAPDEALCQLFHRFVQYVSAQGVQVVFLLMPYHPIVYEHATEYPERYPGFFLTEPWYVRYAQTYGIPLYGSYNPNITGHTPSQFYDGLHIRREAISQIFPGINAVYEALDAGSAKSPWLQGRVRVQYETAERLVTQRYEIALPHRVRQGGDVVIAGELCYTVERYDPSQNNLLLARYAVTRREGIVYRLDTTAAQWVVDAQHPF